GAVEGEAAGVAQQRVLGDAGHGGRRDVQRLTGGDARRGAVGVEALDVVGRALADVQELAGGVPDEAGRVGQAGGERADELRGQADAAGVVLVLQDQAVARAGDEDVAGGRVDGDARRQVQAVAVALNVGRESRRDRRRAGRVGQVDAQ